MESSLSTARKLIPILIASSIRRCQLSGVVCRLTISLKFFFDSNNPSVRISISDTGIGSSLVEFKELDTTTLAISDKWDGVLSITTTGIHDKEIHRFCLSLKKTVESRTRLKRLPPTQKNVGTFSGTEVCLSILEEEKSDELISWVVHFVQKMLVLTDQNVALELIVEHVDSQGSRRNHLLQQNANNSLSMSMSCIELLVSGLENYVVKHGCIVEDKYQACVSIREHLKVGSGQARSTENCGGTGQVVEVGIVIATASSEPCCWRANTSMTQVLYFQDFSLSSISNSSLSALVSVDWKSYGLRLKSNSVDSDGHAVLEWENMSLFAHIDIAIHSYNNRITEPQTRRHSSAERNLIKKAVKNAMDDLKTKHTGLFLSSHALKVRGYAPDLSRALADLIMSSNDLSFQTECAELLGLQSVEGKVNELIESCIREKIVGVIEMNDRKIKGERGAAPCLFECENMYVEEECLDEDDGDAEDDLGILEF